MSGARRRGRRNEGLSRDRRCQCLQDVAALLAAGGEVAANPGENPGSVQGAEATGDLWAGLLHADIPLGALVGKGC